MAITAKEIAKILGISRRRFLSRSTTNRESAALQESASCSWPMKTDMSFLAEKTSDERKEIDLVYPL